MQSPLGSVRLHKSWHHQRIEHQDPLEEVLVRNTHVIDEHLDRTTDREDGIARQQTADRVRLHVLVPVSVLNKLNVKRVIKAEWIALRIV